MFINIIIPAETMIFLLEIFNDQVKSRSYVEGVSTKHNIKSIIKYNNYDIIITYNYNKENNNNNPK